MNKLDLNDLDDIVFSINYDIKEANKEFSNFIKKYSRLLSKLSINKKEKLSRQIVKSLEDLHKGTKGFIGIENLIVEDDRLIFNYKIDNFCLGIEFLFDGYNTSYTVFGYGDSYETDFENEDLIKDAAKEFPQLIEFIEEVGEEKLFTDSAIAVIEAVEEFFDSILSESYSRSRKSRKLTEERDGQTWKYNGCKIKYVSPNTYICFDKDNRIIGQKDSKSNAELFIDSYYAPREEALKWLSIEIGTAIYTSVSQIEQDYNIKFTKDEVSEIMMTSCEKYLKDYYK